MPLRIGGNISTNNTMRSSKMTDLDPEIWNNPTLGSATTTPFLDVLEEQELENRRAKAEGRKPMVAKRDIVYPDYIPSGSVPSDIHPVKLVPAEDLESETDNLIKEVSSSRSRKK
jgi:hypothetical protein